MIELRQQLEIARNENRSLEERLKKFEEKANIELEILELEKSKSLEKKIIPDFFSMNNNKDGGESNDSSDPDEHYSLAPIAHANISVLGASDNEKLSLKLGLNGDATDDDDDDDEDEDDDEDDDEDEDEAHTPVFPFSSEGDDLAVFENPEENEGDEFYAAIEGAPSLRVVPVMIGGNKYFTNGKQDGAIFAVVHMTGKPGCKIGYFEDGNAFFS